MQTGFVRCGWVVLGWLLLIGAGGAQTISLSDPILPIPAPPDLDQRKVDLGRRLFHDPILSNDGTISCASCHSLERGGADGLPGSVGVGGAIGSVNAPTVYNSSLNIAQFWDGRAASLTEQAAGPITNPLEMASRWPDVLRKLSQSSYAAQFSALYSGPLQPFMVQDALATYEQTLMTQGAPFDRWLLGDKSALTERQIQGYRLFLDYGCASCHQGANVGGNLYQRFGFFGSPFVDRGTVQVADWGRYNVTKQEHDRHIFKVPSLRLVVKTAPYFHDGSVADLRDAVRLMALYQLGQDIPDQHIERIIDFFHTLLPAGALPQ